MNELVPCQLLIRLFLNLMLAYLIDFDAQHWSFYAVSVKWQKELFKDVEIDTSQPPYVFKCQLFDLTGVPPERQKIMVKGGLLKVNTLLNVILISKLFVFFY